MFGDTIKHFISILLLLTSTFSAMASIHSTERQTYHLLFLGNSFTFMPDKSNTHPVTPLLVKKLLESKGFSVEIDWVTAGGHTLQNHYDEGIFEKHLNDHENGYYDYVFIQPYSIEALELPSCFITTQGPGVKGKEGHDGPEGREMFLKYGKILVDLVHAHGSKPIVIQPWIYQQGHAWFNEKFVCHDFPDTHEAWYGNSTDYEALLDQGYIDLRKEARVELLKVGLFWKYMRDNPSDTLPMSLMYQEDHYHPTELGALLTAYLEVQRITHLPADQFPFLPDGMDPKQANYLAKVAMRYFTTTALAQ